MAAEGEVLEGRELWRPDPARVARANLTRFTDWLAETRSLSFADYEALWRWSVTETEAFWAAVWNHFEVMSSRPYRAVMSGGPMPETRWFDGALVNYAEHVLRHEARAASDEVALHHASETRPLAHLTWRELGAQVRTLATRLREMGIGPGDRVVSYMPNVPETVVAMLATAAVGAVWAAAAPEFGAKTVIERFQQIEPKLAFASDGYVFGGKAFDRRGEMALIAQALPSLKEVVWLTYLGEGPERLPGVRSHRFEALVAGHPPSPEAFRYERVDSSHPLWVLFSSGTTGKPKAIVHGHAGIVAEHLKYTHLHLDLRPGACMFFYTTTGWMIWNVVVSALMTGASSVLYDGSPVAAGPSGLWRLAQEAGATLFGASPTLVANMKAAGVRPGAEFGLERLDSVVLSGAPSTPETFEWFYRHVKADLWVTSQSGGTELCSGLVGGVPGRPVYAGEIQGRMLGMDVHAWNEDGRAVTEAVGELVVTRPFPSMPLCFWGDPDLSRYRDSYFDVWPQAWRHGDLVKINARGGCFIYGRSDATLNRHGVRIGTAEIYGVVNRIPGVLDSLAVCCETPEGPVMPLFVALEPGRSLDAALTADIKAALRREASPRHVPDTIWQAPAIPYTLTGKKMEIPVRRILQGAAPSAVAAPDAMANPSALGWFAEFAAREMARSS